MKSIHIGLMREQRIFDSTATSAERERARFVAAGNRAAHEAARLVLEEIWCSGLLAGARLELDEVAALVERGTVTGIGRLEHFILVADYAAAGRFVARAPMPGRRREFLTLEEIVQLHAVAARREPEAFPGFWRQTTIKAFPNGTVPPPAWLVPRDMNVFVERTFRGPVPGQHPIAWVADAHERFARIHPFAKGNGRVNRLITNLLLRRIGYPPFAVRGRAAVRYLSALRAADSRNPWPLATVFARAILQSLTRLTAAVDPSSEMLPLASFATGAERAALYKASQRGRLRSVRRGGALLTSSAWIAEYEASRSRRGSR